MATASDQVFLKGLIGEADIFAIFRISVAGSFASDLVTAVDFHPGTPFDFTRETRSPWPGIPS
jgi:hypothetical protein